MGLGRFELPTSSLSAMRSNQLSYKPIGNHSTFRHASLVAQNHQIYAALPLAL